MISHPKNPDSIHESSNNQTQKKGTPAGQNINRSHFYLCNNKKILTDATHHKTVLEKLTDLFAQGLRYDYQKNPSLLEHSTLNRPLQRDRERLSYLMKRLKHSEHHSINKRLRMGCKEFERTKKINSTDKDYKN